MDGHPWRRLAVDVVVRTELRVGTFLDRPRARELARELRRSRALAVAGRALARRDVTRAELSSRLDRRGIGAALRDETLDVLERAGLVQDDRFAAARAAALAGRGYGDAAIRADLERRGLGGEAVIGALAALDPEALRARALVDLRGTGPRMARLLASRGFGEEAVEAALGDAVADWEACE